MCVSCVDCGFGQLCQSYLYDRQLPMFIENLSRKKRVAKGDYIYRRGEPTTALFALRTGTAKIYDNRNQLLGVVLQGQVVGAEDLFLGEYQYSVIAAADIEVCELQTARFYEISQITTDFTNLIVKLLSRSALEKQRFIHVLVHSESHEKVMAYIQLLSDTYKEYNLEYRTFELPLTRKEMAQLLGISLSTLARCLDILIEKHIISLSNKTITLNNHVSANNDPE